ncbi:MAG: dihydroorotase [Elusimicrobia bacterium]|nr:dihydroorotase [Elusimicrobiota bacterium]
MPQRLLIRGGLVIDPEQGLESVRDILSENGRVRSLGRDLARRHPSVPVLDARGCWVLPGLIDLHVHLREPGGEDAEDILSGASAAAAGGFTAVLAMPNTKPPLDSPALLRRLRRKAAAAAAQVLFAGCASKGQQGRELADLRGMDAVSEDGRSVLDSNLMRRALESARSLDIPFMSHCEDPALSRGAPVNEGRASRRLRLPGQSWAAETVMVLRDIALAELTGARLHLCHLSCRQSVEAVRAAKRRGLAVTAEASPHHLALCEDDIPGPDPSWKMNPPLRSRADRAALQEALADGSIDAVATDHAPHSAAKKGLGMRRAPFGVIGLETALPVILHFLVHRGRLSRRRLAECASAAPARILGLARKGSLRPGMDADATLLSPDEPWTVPGRFQSRSANCPFIGMRLRGRVRATVRAGRIVHAL